MANTNYQKTINDLENTRDKLLVENNNLLNENEQLIKKIENTKQKKTDTVIQLKNNPKTTVLESPVKTLDVLPGLVYDFRRSANGSISSIGSLPKGTNQTLAVDSLLPIYKRFVLGKWVQDVNTGFYKDIEQYYCYPQRLYKSNIYVSPTSSSSVIRSFNDNNASVSGWVAIHSGYVVAPFTGNFRFVGCGDDALVIRFNQKLVFDYGYYSLSLGKKISGPSDCNEIATANQGRRLLPEKGVYTDKLEVYYPNAFGKHGVAKGLPISVKMGSVYPIEILYADVEGGQFALALFVERLDSNGKPLKNNPEKLPLFCTSSELPKYIENNDFPDFDKDSPIWRIVDSQGKPIPLRIDEAADKQKSDPNPKKTVSATKQGNATTSRGASTTKTSSGNKPESSSSRIIQTPFGSTQRPVEGEEQ